MMQEFQVKSIVQKGFLEDGVPPLDHFEIVESKLSVNTSQLEKDSIVVQVLCMSCDPYMRGRLKSHGAPPEQGKMTVQGFVSGKIVASNHENWKANDLFGARLDLSTFQHIKDVKGFWKLTEYLTEEEISLGIGAMGMPGSTAYGGLLDILKPEKGQTVFISAASGAVGSLVGQIAKNVCGCKTIGSCGGPAKVDLIKSKFGYDHAIDYKAIDSSTQDKGLQQLKDRLQECSPEGIDMYFENVGGIHFDAAFGSLRPKGRIAVCGGISSYNEKSSPSVKVDIMKMIYTFQRIEGFVCTPWLFGEKGNFLADMSKWIKQGNVKVEETFYDGIESWPAAFQSLFVNTHRNTGKVVVRV